MNIFDERNASVSIIRSDYPGLKPSEVWTGTASIRLKDGSDLKVATNYHPDPGVVLQQLDALLRRRLTPDD
jgi:hypothetical protein